MATEFEPTGVDPGVLKLSTDNGWTQDRKSRKSAAGKVILSEGCKIDAESRGADVVVLSCCEAEWCSAEDG